MTNFLKLNLNKLGKFSVASSLGLLILTNQAAIGAEVGSTEATGTEAVSTEATGTETKSTEATATEATDTETKGTEATGAEAVGTETVDTKVEDNKANDTEVAGTKAVNLGKIEVTGSHIKRVDIEGPSPLLVFDREAIDRSGDSTVAEFIRGLTINTGPAFDEKFAFSPSPGSSSFNMRGLGEDGTLVLIDGRRVANYGFAIDATTTFVDLNSIPLAAIERIEVQKDGASAIYGSDAVAGVVNIILRKDYDATELTVGGGTTSRGGGTEKTANILSGVSNDKNNLTFMFDYLSRENIGRKDRNFSENADHTSKGGTDQRSIANPVSNVFGLGTGDFLSATPPYSPCGGYPCNGTYNYNQDIDLVPAMKKYGSMINLDHEITSNVKLFSQLMYSLTITDLNFTYTPFFADVIVPDTHPDNPYGEPVAVLWRMTDMGIRKLHTETDAMRFLTGLDGMTRNWDWNSAFYYSRSKSVVTGENFVNSTALAKALTDPTAIAGSDYNILINPFGTGRANTQTALDNIRATIERTGISENQGIDIKASRDIAELEHGLLMLAVGAERRHERYTDTPDALTRTGQITALAKGAIADGSRDTSSIFTELDWPVMDNMDIQLAARYENYSDFGTTTNPKLAVRYQPASSLVLRASTGTGFRAPALSELYLSGAGGYDNSLCDPVNYTCPGGDPNQYLVNISGNPNLEAEKSRSSYLGAVFEPINDLSLGIDYWIYNHTNVIALLDSQYIIDHEASYPGRVVRDTGGNITSINNTLDNVSDQKTRGYDLQIQYKKKFGQIGTLGISEMYTHMLEFKRRPIAGQPYEDLVGTYRYPKWKSTTGVSWARDDYSTSLSANYISSYEGAIDPSLKVDAYLTFDFQLTYTGWGFGRATLGVKNLTDKNPPFADEEPGYDFATHDPRGRYIYGQFTFTL